jgi:hypothetical protein
MLKKIWWIEIYLYLCLNKSKTMKNFFKRIWKRMYVKYTLWMHYRAFRPKEVKTQNESICSAICRKMITHRDSEFMIAPLSEKRYIKNPTLNLFVVLEDRQVSITNHVYHYDVRLSDRDWNKLIHSYNEKTENLRMGYENEIKSQIVHSLSKILDKISEK